MTETSIWNNGSFPIQRLKSPFQKLRDEEFKGERNLKMSSALKERTLQTMNFDTILIKIGGKLSKLLKIEYFNIGGMGAAILNI